MDMSVISPFNVLEKAREMKSEVFLSSGDITKEFRYKPGCGPTPGWGSL